MNPATAVPGLLRLPRKLKIEPQNFNNLVQDVIIRTFKPYEPESQDFPPVTFREWSAKDGFTGRERTYDPVEGLGAGYRINSGMATPQHCTRYHRRA